MVSISSGPTTLGHHEMEAAVVDDPVRRKRAAEQVVAGASPDAIKAFVDMQARAKPDAVSARPAERSWWRRLFRRT